MRGREGWREKGKREGEGGRREEGREREGEGKKGGRGDGRREGGREGGRGREGIRDISIFDEIIPYHFFRNIN